MYFSCKSAFMISEQLVFHFPRASPRARLMEVSIFKSLDSISIRVSFSGIPRAWGRVPLKAEAGQATTAVKL